MFTVSLNWSSPAFCSPGLASGSTTTGRELGTGTEGGDGSAGCALVELRGARVLGGGGVGALGAGVASDRARGLRVGFGMSDVIGFSWSALGFKIGRRPALRIAVRTVS